MLEEYRDYFDVPTEADIIIAESQEKLRDLFNEIIKATLEKARNAESELKRIEQEINIKRLDLEVARKKLDEACQRVEQYNRHHLPRKFIEDMLHEVTADIVPGDTVWRIGYENQVKQCECCGGTGRLTAIKENGDPISIECYKCEGYKTVTVLTAKPVKETVHSVRLKLCFQEDSVSYWDTDCIYTGLVGDSKYCVQNIFKTLEKAQAKADEINAKSGGAF